jgi:FtsZ-interacting cell division protein ZipA
MDIGTLLFVIIAIAVVAVAAAFLWQRSRSRRLRSKFGLEYERVIRSEGSARRAEAILERRERQLAKYQTRQLAAEEREQFGHDAQNALEQFVDDPRKAVIEADDIVGRALRARGYPKGDFDHQSAVLSVDYPMVVEFYHEAHAITQRAGTASTEELRRAMQNYRSILENILDLNIAHMEGHLK